MRSRILRFGVVLVVAAFFVGTWGHSTVNGYAVLYDTNTCVSNAMYGFIGPPHTSDIAHYSNICNNAAAVGGVALSAACLAVWLAGSPLVGGMCAIGGFL